MKILFIFIGLVGFLCAQTKLFFVDTLSGLPITSVSIKHQKNVIGVSNACGDFLLPKNIKDTIEINHIAYYSKKIVVKNNIENLIVYLIPKSYNTNEIIVLDKRIETSTPHISIKINDFNRNINTNVADIFKNHTSFFVKDYGSGMSLKTISARGMSAENTLVLFNEARINDLRGGCFDFNSININAIENIDVYMGADENNMFSSVGGVVKITTGNFSKNKTYTTFKYTNDHMKTIIIGHSNKDNLIKYSINFERALSPNKYKYQFENNIAERANAQFNKTFANFDLLYSSSNLTSKLYGHYSYFNTGIPGAVVSNYDGKTNIENISKAIVFINNNNLKIDDDLLYFNTNAFNFNKFTILDADKKLYYPYDKRISELTEFQTTNRLTKKFETLSINFANFTIFSTLNDLSNINLIMNKSPKYTRLLSKTSINIEYKSSYDLLVFINPTFNAAYFYNYIDEKLENKNYDDFSSYKIGMILPTILTSFKITSNFAHDVREPSYSERFYSSVDRFSNKHLKNEDYLFYDIGFQYENNIFVPFNLKVTYFDINAKNKIVWVPIARLPGLQIPVNEGKVKSTGVEIFANSDIRKIYSNISFNYIYNKALNKNKFSDNDNSYNKILVYAPVNKLSLGYTFEYKSFSSNINYTFVGKRYYTADNTPRNKLPKYQLVDCSFSYRSNIDNVKYSFGISIMNLLNEKYFVIQSYPMPLRNYLIFINMEV